MARRGEKMREKEKESRSEQGIKSLKEKNFSAWYDEVVERSGLAEHSSISGCMVIKPHAYAVWEAIQDRFNKTIKALGVKNLYFPLFIPERLLRKEEEHFEGFKAEVAWIERKNDKEERHALRPTSETIMYETFAKWIRSWRDLPLKINQWCNIVRWEVTATRLFLRTREFLWQEGHTAHKTKDEADSQAKQMLEEYRKLFEDFLAIPVLVGTKSEKERFPGALTTYTLEALMPDGKALQLGTSHNLGDHFARSFNIKFTDKDENEKFVWQTSWGFSTRLLGAITMVHGDNRGLVIPPRAAPVQAVIVPILFEDSRHDVIKNARLLKEELGKRFRIELDDRDHYTAGWKFNEWELKGVPLRIEIGPQDITKNQVVIVRRDTGEKAFVKRGSAEREVERILEVMQKSMLDRARKLLVGGTVQVEGWPEFKKAIDGRKLAKAVWCGNRACEEKIQELTAATNRAIPLESKAGGKCVKCGIKGKAVAYFGKAY